MAVDDIIIDIIDILTGANVDFQPASGVEIILRTGGIEGGSATSDGVWQAYDGTLVCVIGSNAASVSIVPLALTFGITNANYLRLKNQNAGTFSLSYSGIQTK